MGGIYAVEDFAAIAARLNEIAQEKAAELAKPAPEEKPEETSTKFDWSNLVANHDDIFCC